MSDIPTAAQIAAFFECEENVEALTEAVQELNNIFINGTSDRPPVGIVPVEESPSVSAGTLIFLAADRFTEK